jgi:hypothetical protein
VRDRLVLVGFLGQSSLQLKGLDARLFEDIRYCDGKEDQKQHTKCFNGWKNAKHNK